MPTFKDILDGGFETHARALPAGGGFSGDRLRSALRSIHRRRRTRAAAAAGGSVLAVGAVALGVMALNPPLVARPGSTPVITRGLYPWCDVSTYPAVNPDALGASRFQGRVYEDYVNMVFVYVAPDGRHTTLSPRADGTYRMQLPDGELEYQVPLDMKEFFLNFPQTRGGVVTDLDLDGGRSFFDPGGRGGPLLGYEWTTSVPDIVPPGVDVARLSAVLVTSLGFGGAALSTDTVPPGAIVETVFRWHDGSQFAVQIHKDESGASVPDYVGLASVSVRVSSLPDGEVFEITSTYDPSMTWQVACWPYRDATSPSATATVGPEPTPSWAHTIAPDPGISQGGFDAGPTPSPSHVTPAPSPSRPLPSGGPSPTP